MEPAVCDYEVFLSFRGPDARQALADVLHYHMEKAGIRVFKDDDELAVGDKIETVVDAIKSSQICVPIFSQTFASSKWCLREVRLMAKLNKEIAPIFYKVTPDDVKLKTKAYRRFMKKYRKKNGEKKVKKWENALKAAAENKGMEVLDKSYTGFCQEFVNQILRKLKPRQKFDVDDVIGLEDQFESVMKLLGMESIAVRYIGIYGMGGIGKTTLAKLIHNRCSASFECCSFIKDIRESSKYPGIDYLQKQLQNSLDPNPRGGFNFSKELKERFRAKKVLIVLDDIYSPEQVEELAGESCWFGPGSRIIVTTRNSKVLTKCRRLKEMEVSHFEMDILKDEQSLQLFSRCAFREDSPPDEFKHLSEEAISTCGGLPLALTVIGSLLRNEEKGVWEDVIAKSKKIPVQEVKDRLKISYEKLEPHPRQIFLDVACFRDCKHKLKACHMWKACQFFPDEGLAVLKSLCLIKITGNNQIWMHDQLRDLGKDIVRSESDNPRKRSRVWEHEEALKVLRSKKRKKRVQGLCLDKPCSVDLTQEELAPFKNLRFLRLQEAEFRGDLNNLLQNLNWLSWRAPLRFDTSNFTVSNLVNLDLSDSSMTETWPGWSLLQSARALRVLDLRRCLKLKSTPRFPEDMILQRLILAECKSLVTIDGSIGNLKCLTQLDLQRCKSICVLTESIGELVQLQQLSLTGTQVTELPHSIGALKSLVSFNLEGTNIIELPSSIGGLVQLEELCLSFSKKLRTLPYSIGELTSLVDLKLERTAISELPSSIGRLGKLEQLDLSRCSSLRALPHSVGELKSLTDLHLRATTISELPCSVGRLGKLEWLDLSGCFSLRALPHSVGELKSLTHLFMHGATISELPSSIGKLRKLEWLDLNRCSSLQALPHSVGKLKSLTHLVLCGTAISELPSSIGRLGKLEWLGLSGCSSLQALPHSVGKLKSLTHLDLPSSIG